jgi:hypothetical protein
MREGKPEKELQLLAASPGVTPEAIAEAVKLALLPPLADGRTWALVRGRRSPYMLVQSGMGPSGQTILHYILPPPEALRGLAGNLKALLPLVQDNFRSFEKVGDKLKTLVMPPSEAPTTEQQVDDILDLMTNTHNRIETIEELLAAIVQGVTLVVVNAPSELETRVKFVQSLLALVPPSARSGVTFATHTLPSTKADTQIRFLAGENVPSDAVIYDWTTGKVGGQDVDDVYSHFITSQLRLDAELVSKQTRALTTVAAWRIKRNETLADALGYAAYRFKVDEAVLNNQPVEIADVSKVLSEDPTLSDTLKIAYTRHLLAVSLALGDMQYADPIAITLRQQPDLEVALQQVFVDKIQEGKAGLVYDTLSRWIANPLGPTGMKWVEVTHKAALAHMDALVKARDVKAINTFLESIHHADAGVEISRVVPKLIEMALPLTVLDRDLNLTVFLLAINYLDSDVLRRLIGTQKFSAQLPPSLGRLMPYITREDVGLCPTGLLVDTAASFGEQWQNLVLVRLAEAAVHAKRPDIIDTPALAGLVRLIGTPVGLQYSQVIAWIARNASTDEELVSLDDPGPTYILQILLGLGDYNSLGDEMLHQARLLYPGDKQTNYVVMVRRLFAETKLEAEQIPAALDAINERGIKSLPLAMAYIGALEGHEWASALDPVAEASSKMLLENPSILEMMESSAMIALLRFHIKRRDVANTIRVAGLLPRVAVREGTKGIGVVGRMYKMMDWEERVQIAALELLRRYVRLAEDDDAKRAISAFGREFGINVQQSLEATYAFKKLMGGLDLLDYAEFLHITAEFLHETAQAYSDKDHIPVIGALMNDLDSLTGGLTDDDRRKIVTELVGLGKAIVVLGDHYLSNRPRDFNKHVEGLLNGKNSPISALDILWIMGGYLTKGKRYPLKMETTVKVHPLGARSANLLRDESEVINTVLRSLTRAFPPDKKLTISVEAVRGEMESLWGDIPLHDQREVVRNLAIDLQKTAELTMLIAEQGGGKAMEDSGLARKLDENKQQPKNTLEFYRFVSGYFKARTR